MASESASSSTSSRDGLATCSRSRRTRFVVWLVGMMTVIIAVLFVAHARPAGTRLAAERLRPAARGSARSTPLQSPRGRQSDIPARAGCPGVRPPRAPPYAPPAGPRPPRGDEARRSPTSTGTSASSIASSRPSEAGGSPARRGGGRISRRSACRRSSASWSGPLDDPDRRVRIALIRAIGEIGDRAGARRAGPPARRAEPDGRAAGRGSPDRSGHEVVPEIVAYAETTSAPARAAGGRRGARPPARAARRRAPPRARPPSPTASSASRGQGARRRSAIPASSTRSHAPRRSGLGRPLPGRQGTRVARQRRARSRSSGPRSATATGGCASTRRSLSASSARRVARPSGGRVATPSRRVRDMARYLGGARTAPPVPAMSWRRGRTAVVSSSTTPSSSTSSASAFTTSP